MSILGSKIFYINSENRISGSSSNFTYELSIPSTLKVDSCCVLAMTVPRSYYLVRDGQNTFTLIVDGVENIITVKPGNYSSINFATTLEPLLAPFAAITMSLDKITGKYTYSYAGASTVAIKLYSRLAHQMGFAEESTNVFSDGVLTSTNVVDFISTSTLYLHSDMVDDSTSILQEVYPENSVPFSNIVYNCRNLLMYSKKLIKAKRESSVFNFSLTDEHQKEVFLNGHDICVTLLLYKKENLTALLQNIFPPGGGKR